MCVCCCSGFSPEVVFYTTGTLPALPLAPRLLKAGVSWVTLEWGRPEGSASEEQLKYTLEIQEDNTVSSALDLQVQGVQTGVKASLNTCALPCGALQWRAACHKSLNDGIKVRFSPSGNGLSSQVHWRKLDLYCTRPEEEHAV